MFIQCLLRNAFFPIVKLLEACRAEKPEHSSVFLHKYVLMAADKPKVCGFYEVSYSDKKLDCHVSAEKITGKNRFFLLCQSSPTEASTVMPV